MAPKKIAATLTRGMVERRGGAAATAGGLKAGDFFLNAEKQWVSKKASDAQKRRGAAEATTLPKDGDGSTAEIGATSRAAEIGGKVGSAGRYNKQMSPTQQPAQLLHRYQP